MSNVVKLLLSFYSLNLKSESFSERLASSNSISLIFYCMSD